MIIVMASDTNDIQIHGVVRRIESIGLKAHLSQGTNRTVIGVIGN